MLMLRVMDVSGGEGMACVCVGLRKIGASKKGADHAAPVLRIRVHGSAMAARDANNSSCYFLNPNGKPWALPHDKAGQFVRVSHMAGSGIFKDNPAQSQPRAPRLLLPASISPNGCA